ncbi:unnamed protein product [Ectocarpus sp. 12 AP-2014]
MSPSLAVMGAEPRCNENSRSGRRSSSRDAWSCGRGGSRWQQETGEQRRQEGRSTRRRRRTFCAVSAVIAGCVAASLPCGAGFVAPGVQQACGRSAPTSVPSYVRSAAPGGGETRRSGMRRRRPSDAVHMVAMEPRVNSKGSATETVAPARPAGKEGPHLPWTGSMAGPEFPLTYMPFMEHMLNVLARSFGEMTALPLADNLAFVENTDKKARMLSMNFASPEVRKVRLTYFDAGDKVQVLNAVIYPDPSLDMPLLGIDLISFGGKHLAGIDFQPLFDDDSCRGRYSDKLAPIKAKYPEFAQKMSPRFYDSARFFSEEMLFGRYEDEAIVDEKLFPAFDEYLSLYISDLLKAAEEGGNPSPEARARVLDRHRAYDQYNAERDPAHGLFRTYFGEAYSEDFMDNFLFELSTRPEGGYPKGAARGGGGGANGRPAGGNSHA